MPDGWCDGGGSRGAGGRCIRHAPEATPRAVGPLVVPVIEPAFRAALMPRVRALPLAPLRGCSAGLPTVGLPPVAGPTDGEHRRAPHPAAAHRAPPLGAGAHAGPTHRGRRVTRRRGGTGETDRPAGKDGGARTRMPTPSRSHVIETRGTRACLDEDLGRRVPRSSPGQAYRSRAARRDTALHGDVCWHGRCASRVSVGSRRPRRHTQPGVPRDTGGATSRRPPQLKKGGPFLLAIPTCPGFPAWGVRTPAFDSRPAGVRRPARRCSSCPRAPARPAVPLPGNAQTDDKPARSPCGLCRRPAAAASATNAAGDTRCQVRHQSTESMIRSTWIALSLGITIQSEPSAT